MRDCGGCKGLGSHIRWCPEVVGFFAAHWGRMSQQAGNMADSVGANNPGLANVLYRASGELRDMALERSATGAER